MIPAFRFCIGIINEPEIEDGEDPRLDVMHALAEHMHGVFFAPGALLDSHFRAFAEAGNDVDPEAVIPGAPPETFGEDEDDDEDCEPPDAERVAARAYVLAAVAARGLLDMNLMQGNSPAYRLDELQEWFGSLGIDDELEPEERKILETPEQQLPQQDVINSVWCLEALAVLAWALRLADLPPYDELVEVDEFLSTLGLLNPDKARANLATPQLRPRAELDRYNEQIWAYNWRMVDFRIRPKAVDYANVDFGSGPFDLDWAVLADGDLTLQGTPITKADPNLVRSATSTAQERHRASNWLTGQTHLFSQRQHRHMTPPNPFRAPVAEGGPAGEPSNLRWLNVSSLLAPRVRGVVRVGLRTLEPRKPRRCSQCGRSRRPLRSSGPSALCEAACRRGSPSGAQQAGPSPAASPSLPVP